MAEIEAISSRSVGFGVYQVQAVEQIPVRLFVQTYAKPSGPSMKPNILIFQCHDLGDHIGCYPGNSAITPALDYLASQGVVFENHFAPSPTCSPSRASAASGLYPQNHGLMALASGGHWEINARVPVLSQLLKDVGYSTASFGVWHINEDRAAKGIDTFDGKTVSEDVTQNALSYMDQRDKTKPFFVLANFREPHRPFMDVWKDRIPPDEINVPPYLPDDPSIREELSRFYGDVSRVDACVGKFMDYLQRHDLERNTIIVFTTDHGIGMPLAKGTLYDAGLKVSLIIRYPDHVAANRRCNALTANMDILPTLLEAIGEDDRIPEGLDGRSLWPFLDRSEDVGHEALYPSQTWHDYYEPMRAIRTDRHKLIRNYETGKGVQIAADILYTDAVEVMREELLTRERPEWELYDLKVDSNEQQNLAGQPEYMDLENSLKARLLEFMANTDDPLMHGPVAAPPGYWEHFMSKPAGPGSLPVKRTDEHWLTLRWPFGLTRHACHRRN